MADEARSTYYTVCFIDKGLSLSFEQERDYDKCQFTPMKKQIMDLLDQRVR